LRRTYSAALARVERSMAEQATRSLGVTIARKPVPRLVRATPAGDGDEFWVTGVAKTRTAAKCIADRIEQCGGTPMFGRAMFK